jgi:hypothetical protein
MKCFIIPVIIVITVTKGLRKYMETVPGKHSTDSISLCLSLSLSNMKAVLGALFIIRKVL